MSRLPMTPPQIIEAARQRLAQASSAEGLHFEELTAIGMLGALDDLQLIDHDSWRATRAEFDQLADSRRQQVVGAQ